MSKSAPLNPTLQVMSRELADRLAPIRDAGVFVRRLPEKPKTAGSNTTAGVLTIRLESIGSEETTLSRGLAGASQSVVQNWVIDGRVRDLAAVGGLYGLFDWLTNQLFGYKPSGANGAISFAGFEVKPRLDVYWIFEYRISIPVNLSSAEC